MFIILEIQTDWDNNVAMTPVEMREDWNEALSVYYSKLAYSATSNTKKHTVAIINEEASTKDKRVIFGEEKK